MQKTFVHADADPGFQIQERILAPFVEQRFQLVKRPAGQPHELRIHLQQDLLQDTAFFVLCFQGVDPAQDRFFVFIQPRFAAEIEVQPRDLGVVTDKRLAVELPEPVRRFFGVLRAFAPLHQPPLQLSLGDGCRGYDPDGAVLGGGPPGRFLQRREILLGQRLPGIEALLSDDPGGHPHLRAVVEPQHHPAAVSGSRCELLQDHTRSSSSKSSAEMFTAPPATVAGPGAGAPRRLAIFSSCCRATSARMAASSASACSGLSRR